MGLAMLAWLYAGAPAVAAEWRLLHASLQIFGFFETLICAGTNLLGAVVRRN